MCSSEAGHLLQQLRNARNVADYDIQQKITRGDIAGLLPIVRDIFAVLSEITEREAHDAADAMRKYERNVLGEQTWRGKPR